jgi:hypothetical protein
MIGDDSRPSANLSGGSARPARTRGLASSIEFTDHLHDVGLLIFG